MNKFVEILRNNWELSSPELKEAPRGFVAETYNVSDLGDRYFLKIIDSRSRYAVHIKLILPALAELYEKGIQFINYPIPTINGDYYVIDGEHLFVLFNYISGQSGFDYSKKEYAKRLKILHDFDADSIDASVPKENFEVNFID
ncbi:MAG: hypothetical protein Kow0081_2460 [Candidatus Dojkabacteria bacterium]